MALRRVQVFSDIVVMPTQDLLHSMGSAAKRGRDGIYRGGPIWPHFYLQVRARHCRGLIPIPRDRRPRPCGEPARTVEAGVWCGPVTPHFGHMIADFGMRIARAAHRTAGMPLVFSMFPDETAQPPPFFWAILRHLGVPDERVMLIREPTRFRRLLAAPQSERHFGPGPSADHLDLMDEVVALHGPVTRDIGLLFVSRALFPDGRLAAEPYLDSVLRRSGATVIHPETFDLKMQLDFYRRARTIVFSEGSAMHSLQLLGRLDADVVVLVRRSGMRLARRMVGPRVRSLAYWDLTTGLIYGRNLRGKRQLNRALSVLDEAALLARFRAIGADLAPWWDGGAYCAWRDADIRRWIAYMKHWDLHPRSSATIARCLRAAGIDISVEDVPAMVA